MSYQKPTTDFLSYLSAHPVVCDRIRAAPNRTLLYAGSFVRPMWREIELQKRTNPDLAKKETLPEVLRRITVPGTGHASLLAYAQDTESKVPWNPDGFMIWRALSAIFASHAVGAVSFQVGSDVDATKVFVTTEVGILLHNPKVDGKTKDLLAYYQRCIQSGEVAINVGFMSA
jgi:hypothetical protein